MHEFFNRNVATASAMLASGNMRGAMRISFATTNLVI